MNIMADFKQTPSQTIVMPSVRFLTLLAYVLHQRPVPKVRSVMDNQELGKEIRCVADSLKEPVRCWNRCHVDTV